MTFGPTSPVAPTQLASNLAAQQAPTQPQGGGGGFSIFGWHPSIPNLGAVTAVKQFASGITGLVETPFRVASGEESLGDAAGGLAKGFGEGALNLAATAGRVVGVPGTDISLEGPVRDLGHELIGKDFNAENAFTRPGGPIAGLVSDALTAATFAAPIAGSLSTAADGAVAASKAAEATATAAEDAVAAGTGDAAAAEVARAHANDLSARAAEAIQHRDIAQHFAKPFGYLMDRVAQIPRAAAAEIRPPVGEVVEGAASPAEVMGTAAHQEVDLTPVVDAVKATQNPVASAAASIGDHPTLEAEVKPPEGVTPAGESTPTKPSTFGSPEEAAQINDTVAQAQEGVRQSQTAKDIAAKLLEPPPPWAQRIAKALPNSVDRVLAHLQVPIDNHYVNAVARDLGRLTEVSQRAARGSAAVAESTLAARQILDLAPKVTGFDVSHMVGEEITSKLTGTAMVDAAVKETMGNASPEVVDAMSHVAKLHYPGVPKAIRDTMTPEQWQAFDAATTKAADAWKVETTNRFNTLLSSHYGSQGVEQAILGDSSPVMTPGQVRMYRKAMLDLRSEQKLRERVPEMESARQAEAQRVQLGSDQARAEADSLLEKVGVAQRTAAAIRDGVPKGLEHLDRTIADIKQGVVDGGITYNIGRGEAVHPTEGFSVNIGTQFDVPMEEFIANGDALIGKAVASPVGVDGELTGSSIWNGPDAQLTVEPHVGDNGQMMVRGSTSMHTNGGVPLTQWQASVLGEAYRNDVVHSLAPGVDDLHTTMQPEAQNLMAHYVDMALNPQSGFSKFANKLTDASAGADRIDAAAIDAQLRFYAQWDYSLSRSASEWKVGDYFKNLTADFGKLAPNLPALLQTVLGLPGTKEALDAALATMEPAQVAEALKWYYESHDYIEQMWGNKDITLLDGSVRPAKDVFYDLLAVTSVMASPKQNLGRALMALSNLEEFLGSRRNAMATAQKLMSRLDRAPVGVGTDYALKFEKFPEVRALTEQTSMVTAPKYNVMDILTGRLRLDDATNADIGNLPEYWTGNTKALSDNNLDPQSVIETLDRNNIHTPEAERYRQQVAAHRQLAAHADTMNTREFKPITATQNEDTGTGINQSRQISPAEFEQLAQEGKGMLADRKAHASEPTGLTDNVEQITNDAYKAIQDEWGGVTIDAHTGAAVPDGADTYAVTTKPAGLKAVTMPIGVGKPQFAAALRKALVQFHDELAMEGAHLGVFHNVESGKIEIDPVQVTADTHEVEAMGAASHAKGGAYHFASGLGYWVPYVGDEFATKASYGRAVKASADVTREALHAPSVAPHYERALMEHHGSNALAKLRSFRSNLADPEHSLSVTLDSVMARMYGMRNTDWAGGNTYGQYANEIRDAADMLSKRFGRTVMPHEVQALLWVYTKQEVGRLDWGRLLDHHDMGQGQLDYMQQLLDSGKAIDPESFDPLRDYYNEELQHSEEAQAVRARIALLKKGVDSGTAPESDIAELAHLETVNKGYSVPKRTTVSVKPDRADISVVPNESGVFQDRFQIPHDAKKLAARQESYGNYATALDDMRAALREGNVEEARHQLTSYVVGLKRSITGDVGGSFQTVGEETRHAAGTASKDADIAYTAEQGLQRGRHVPTPEQWDGPADSVRGSMDELHQRFNDHIRGATIMPNDPSAKLNMRLYKGAAIDTLAHEGAHLLRQMLPPDALDWVRSKYPHILDTRLTAARRDSEEAFVTDLMRYIRGVVHEGKDAGAGSDAFRRIAATHEEQFAGFLDTLSGASTTPDIAAFWQRMFQKDIEAPDVFSDPIGAQRVAPGGVETKQFQWESPAEFAQRARQYGEARQAVETARVRAQVAAQRARKADGAARRMWAALQAPTLTELRADALHARAYDTLERLGAQLESPSTGNVPAAWQPLWNSFRDIHAAAKEDTSGQLAEALHEIPENFAQALQFAAERGFDPTHVQDLTWEQAQQFLFGHIQLRSSDEPSGLRRTREGVLSRNHLADHSLEALGAGNVAAMREVNVGQLVDWVERSYSQPFDGAHTAMPEGWVSWDRTRTRMLTGTDREGNVRAPTATRIIPAHVDQALRGMEKNYDNWAFHLVTRVTSPWRTLIMSFSPAWYLKHATGSIVLASAEGVRISDWMNAFRQFRDHTLPEDVKSIHSFAQSSQAEGVSSLIPRGPKEALQAEGVKSAIHSVQQTIFKVNNAINEISRGAVYGKVLREGGSAERALTKAYTALGDYGDLSPFERSAVRAVIPFYSFQKAMLKLVMKFPADHPLATELMMLLGAVHKEQMEDKLGGPIPDAYNGLANLGGLGVRNIGFINPFRDAANLITPQGISNSFNPYLDLFVRQAYNAPASAATSRLVAGPTGKPVMGQDPTAAIAEMIQGLPQARLAQSALSGGDVYGNNPGVAQSVANYLGEPKQYTPADIARIAGNVRKSQTGAAAGWYPGFNAPKGTPSDQTPQAFAAAKTPTTAAPQQGLVGFSPPQGGPKAPVKPKVTKPRVRKPRLTKIRLKKGHLPRIPKIKG